MAKLQRYAIPVISWDNFKETFEKLVVGGYVYGYSGRYKSFEKAIENHGYTKSLFGLGKDPLYLAIHNYQECSAIMELSYYTSSQVINLDKFLSLNWSLET